MGRGLGLALWMLVVIAGCGGGGGNGATDAGVDTPIPADGSRSDAAFEEAASSDTAAETIDVGDELESADSLDVGDAGDPGCLAPVNVVSQGLALTVEIDLSDYATREYAVTQRIKVVPEIAGESISLYGASLLMGTASAPYRYDGNLATFCTGAFAAGEAVTVDVDYVISEAHQAFPPGSLAGMRVWGPTTGDFAIGPFSSPYFASTWLLVPQTQGWFSKDHDGNGIADRYELRIIVPGHEWVVVGPGTAQVDGDIWRFLVDQAAPVYTLSFAASPAYELVDAGTTVAGVDLLAGVTAASKPNLLQNLQAAAAAVDWMSAEIGPYPWGETLSFAEVPTFSGGMEHTAAIWLGSGVIDGGETGDYVAVHEAVHHWWGNHVQIADWPHFWLSEGLTEWTTIFAILETIGDPDWVADLQETYRRKAAEASYPASPGAAMPGPLRFSDEGDIMEQVSNNLLFFYYYGAAFLEMVDQRLQRDFGTGLLPILEIWYQDFGGDRATTEDLLVLLSDETGAPGTWELLFQDWVYTGPAPTLELSDYSVVDGFTTLTLTRTGGAGQDLSQLEVVFDLGDAAVLESVFLPSGLDTVTIQATMDQPPERIVVDPDGLYILRLETAPGFSGPPVERTL